MLLTLSGTIGVGKTTWSEIIGNHFGVDVLKESVDDNPFLPLYYDNPKQYSFHLQVYFLNHRFKAIKDAMVHPNTVLDRSIYEDSMIFAKLQYLNGFMTKIEYDTYLKLQDNMMEELKDLYEGKALHQKSPDLLIHLDGSFDEIQRRVKKRGRDFEQTDNNPELLQYYKDLYKLYDTFVDEYLAKDISPVYILDIDKYDANNPDDVAKVLSDIEAVLDITRGYVR